MVVGIIVFPVNYIDITEYCMHYKLANVVWKNEHYMAFNKSAKYGTSIGNALSKLECNVRSIQLGRSFNDAEVNAKLFGADISKRICSSDQ